MGKYAYKLLNKDPPPSKNGFFHNNSFPNYKRVTEGGHKNRPKSQKTKAQLYNEKIITD